MYLFIFFLCIYFIFFGCSWLAYNSKTYFPNNPRQVYFGVVYSFPENFSNSVGVHLNSLIQEMSPTKNFFLQLVSKFCGAIARQVPRGFTWCNRPWNVSIRFCCSERCYKWYLIFCCWTEVVKTNVLDESTLTRGGKLYNPSDESYFRVSDKQLHLHI